MECEELLRVDGVSVSFDVGGAAIEVVDQVSFSIGRGRTMALVGESGCGKSVTAAAIMRLLPHPFGRVTSGRVRFDGSEILELPLDRLHGLRGGSMAMIFQEPMTALNPVQSAGKQISEVLELHRADVPKKSRRQEILELLERVEMPSPASRMKNYPFQLSGGMRQRVMIAMALAGEPKLLIADEPTTALDVTVQAQILKLIRGLQERTGMGVLYITHDMGVVAQISHDVAVMYAGQIIESGPVETIFSRPAHPYTRGLIDSMPSLESVPKARLSSIPGLVPSPANYSAACRFAARCAHADGFCASNRPSLEPISAGHSVRCFKAGKI